MTEALLMTGVALAGFLLLLPLDFSPSIKTVMAFPVGVIVWLLVGLVLVAGPLTYRPSASLAWLGATALPGAIVATRRKGAATAIRSLPWAAGLAAVTFVASLGAQALDATNITVDSVRYLLIGDALARVGGVDAVSRGELLTRGVVVPLMHAPSGLVGRQHLASLTPLLGLTGIATLLVLLSQTLSGFSTPRRWRGWLLASLVILILGSNRAVYHAFYVNAHMLFAVGLILLVFGYWMAASTGSVQWVLPSLPGVALLVAIRPEGALVLAPFLIVAMAYPELPAKARWLPAIPFALAAVGWFGLIVAQTRQTAWSLAEPEVGLVAVGIVVGVLAVLVAIWPNIWVIRVAPYAAVVGPLAALLGLAARDTTVPSIARRTFVATASNLASEGHWAFTWWVLPLAAVAAWAVLRFPHQRLWTAPLAAFTAIFFLLPFLREGGYRIGTGDSGNRILMHILPVVLGYVILAAGWGAARGATVKSEP